MLYHIEFYKKEISTEDWQKFTNELLRLTNKYRFGVYINKNKARFYIECEVDPTSFNERFFPLRLVHSPGKFTLPQKKTKRLILPQLMAHNFFEFMNLQMAKRNITEAALVLDMKAAFDGRILRRYRGQLVWTSNGKAYRKRFYGGHFPAQFFSFDLTKKVFFQLDTASATLKKSEAWDEASQEGVFLEIKSSFNEFKRLNIKDYDFDRHTLVLGQSGAGKSRFLKLFVKNFFFERMDEEYSILVIDPHGEMATLRTYAQNGKNIDFQRNSIDLFAQGSDPLLTGELVADLFKTVMGASYTERVGKTLKYSLFALLLTNQLSVQSLKLFLTNLDERRKVLEQIKEHTSIVDFFESEFPDYQQKFYDTSILPIINLVEELNFIPVFQNKLGEMPLKDIINGASVNVLSVDRTKLGDRSVLLVGGLAILQSFLLAQSGQLKKKLILIVDEVSTVQNESISKILSESRKFGLSTMLFTQYLHQLDEKVLHSVFSNVVNYFIFRSSVEDAKVFANIFKIDLEGSTAKEHSQELDNQVKLFTNLNPREVIAKVMKNNRYYKPFLARTVDSNERRVKK